MTDQMLREAFDRIADRAEPVPDLAEKALRRADRRRTTMVSGTAVLGLAAAVGVTAVFVTGGPGKESDAVTAGVGPAGASGLPANNAAEQKVVTECLRGGSPTDDRGKPQARFGKPADFRLLLTMRTGTDELALVGSTEGFVLCARAKQSNAEAPYFRPWPQEAGKTGLWDFNGEGRIDAVGDLPRSFKAGSDPNLNSLSRFNSVVVGRVKPQVKRVATSWRGGPEVAAQAVVGNGFFMASTPSVKLEKSPNQPTISIAVAETRLTMVKAFSATGNWEYEWAAGQSEGVRSFDSNDCPGASPEANAGLCEGLPKN